MTPAQLKFVISDLAPELIDITICSDLTGAPFMAFSCNREELVARLQQTPVSTVEQLTLGIQVPEVPTKPLRVSIFA